MKDWIKSLKVEHIIAFYVLTFCFAYLFYISSSRLPNDKAQLISDVKIGVIGTITLVCGYFFGSSRGSEKKDEVIRKAAENTIDNNKTDKP